MTKDCPICYEIYSEARSQCPSCGASTVADVAYTKRQEADIWHHIKRARNAVSVSAYRKPTDNVKGRAINA